MKKVLAAVLVCLVLAGCGKSVKNTDERKIYELFDGGTLIYNSRDGAYKDDSGEVTFLGSKSVVCADKEHIVFKGDSDAIEIFSHDGELITTVDLSFKAIDIAGNTLVYSDDAGIYAMNIDDGGIKKLSDDTTDSLKAEGAKIVYEHDKNTLKVMDIEGGEAQTVFEGMYCFYFDIEGEKIYLSDYARGQEIIVIDIDNKSNAALEDVRSVIFTVIDDEIAYLPHIEETGESGNTVIRKKIS